VLNGLGPKFNSFVVAVTTAATSRADPLRFANIHGLLLNHEALLTAQTPQTSLPSFSSRTTFYTRSNYPNGYNLRPNTYRHPKPFSPTQTLKPPNLQYQPRPNAPIRPTYRALFNPPTGPRPNKYKDPKFVCQIYSKSGHSVKIFHWRYDISNSSPYQALTAQPPSASPPSTEWVLDFDATNHVTNDLNNLSSFYEYVGSDNLQTGSGTDLPIQHIGSYSLPLNSLFSITLVDVLHVPQFTKNLISLSRLMAVTYL
jgi:hypothetical protein